MTTYADVQRLLNNCVQNTGADGAPHGAFWKTQTRDQFVNYVFRGIRLISPAFDPNDSGLVKALEGSPPFGKDSGNPGERYNRMPSGMPAMSPADIATIRNWITARCPS